MSHPLSKKEHPLIGMMRFVPSRVAFFTSVIILILCALFPAWKLLPDIQLRAAIPLHYNVHSGIDLFGPWWRIFLIPEIGAGLLLVNTLAALFYWHRERTLSLLFLGTAVVGESVLFFAMLFVVLLNLSYA